MASSPRSMRSSRAPGNCKLLVVSIVTRENKLLH
jgi:hypothetical protein